MEVEKEELNEVIVQSTRTSRTIKNTPTRVETIDGEELDEKNNMRPANVSMLLHESTGLQVQQTSATSGNASIRVQGLDGRYTQLLKDGYSNFGNFASGLSISSGSYGALAAFFCFLGRVGPTSRTPSPWNDPFTGAGSGVTCLATSSAIRRR